MLTDTGSDSRRNLSGAVLSIAVVVRVPAPQPRPNRVRHSGRIAPSQLKSTQCFEIDLVVSVICLNARQKLFSLRYALHGETSNRENEVILADRESCGIARRELAAAGPPSY